MRTTWRLKRQEECRREVEREACNWPIESVGSQLWTVMGVKVFIRLQGHHQLGHITPIHLLVDGAVPGQHTRHVELEIAEPGFIFVHSMGQCLEATVFGAGWDEGCDTLSIDRIKS